MRVGLYIDALYRAGPPPAARLHTNPESLPFLLFACEVGRHFDDLVLFGREAPPGGPAVHPLPAGPSLVGLPFYSSLAELRQVVRALPGSARASWRGLAGVDVLWVFGPHPYGLLLALLALTRRRRVVLGCRQDTMPYFRRRLRRPAEVPLLVPLWLLWRSWRALATIVPATVVGPDLERRYGGPRRGLLAMTVSLVAARDVGRRRPRPAQPADVSVLTVGRLEPEKDPCLLLDAFAALARAERARAWRLTIAGTGRLADATRRRAEALGISPAVTLVGFVPPGDRLLELYAASDVFVHVARTEGVPQVILEALATGTPVVATAVGGVAETLEHGRAGWLVPPGDRSALAAAIREVVSGPDERERRVRRGLAIARERSLEREAARVARWLQSTLRAR